jgi:electron transfer flavoprotein alpha subunit
MSANVDTGGIWVIDTRVDTPTRERLGDARQLADALSESVGALIVGPECDSDALVASGADTVKIADGTRGAAGRVTMAEQVLSALRPRVVLASGSPDGREWAARLAARLGWQLYSPALQAEVDRGGQLVVTILSHCGRFSRKHTLGAEETAVLTFEPGIAEKIAPRPNRSGDVERLHTTKVADEPIRIEREVPADPSAVDIRYADRLIAGGRGLGNAEAFQRLTRIAKHLGAGVAASRVAVDLGWADRERQVGQTGRTVSPTLYLACGISGASHHLAGMSDAKHIVAINSDPDAPIFKTAHLGLVSDVHDVLFHLETQLSSDARSRR